MSETSSAESLDAAYRLIDSITRLKGIVGAMLLEQGGDVIAEDFISQEHASRCGIAGKELIPELVAGCADLKLGDVTDVVFQTSAMTVRSLRQDALWLLVFAGDNANIGMLNVELRGAQDQLKIIVGGSAADERDAQKQHIIDLLRTEGTISPLLEERSSDIGQLRALHGLMFQIALDAGVSRATISRQINEINYRLYRDSLLDIGFDFFNRKALDNYDPSLARKVMREQITGLAGMVLSSLQ